MTWGELLIACISATVGGYEALISMFVHRPPASVWLLSPIVPVISWLLNGTLGDYRFAYLLLCSLCIMASAVLYAVVALGFVRLIRRLALPREDPRHN